MTNQDRRICDTCKHNPPSKKWPCADCDMRNPADRWEPKDVPDTNAGDMVSRRAAIDALMDEFKRAPTTAIRAKNRIDRLPSAQPEGWLEQNKAKILQAGMEGREIEFRIGGRLFAIREKAQ